MEQFIGKSRFQEEKDRAQKETTLTFNFSPCHTVRKMRNTVRHLRSSAPLDHLFPRIRQGVLAATLLHPERGWHLRELASYLDVTPSSLQRELAGLVSAGILEQEPDGNRINYRPDPTCPFLNDLQGLFAKTIGLADVLKEALRPALSQIEIAFVYGSVARRSEASDSDVDVLLIGSLRLADMALPLRAAENALQRPINPTLYTAPEYSERMAAGNHFLTALRDVPKIFLKGTEDDLARLAQPAQSADSPDQFAGDR